MQIVPTTPERKAKQVHPLVKLEEFDKLQRGEENNASHGIQVEQIQKGCVLHPHVTVAVGLVEYLEDAGNLHIPVG